MFYSREINPAKIPRTRFHANNEMMNAGTSLQKQNFNKSQNLTSSNIFVSFLFLAEGEGVEPSWLLHPRFSRPLPYHSAHPSKAMNYSLTNQHTCQPKNRVYLFTSFTNFSINQVCNKIDKSFFIMIQIKLTKVTLYTTSIHFHVIDKNIYLITTTNHSF